MAQLKRKYSDDEKAGTLAALDANRGNALQTSKQLGIPRTTIKRWVAEGVNPDVTVLRHEKRRELSAKLEDIAHALSGNILIHAGSPDAARGSLKEMAVALGIVIDKMQVLRGMPSAPPQPVEPDVEAVSREFQEKARARGYEITLEEARSYIEPRLLSKKFQ